jgi:hypothetical protein
MGHEVYANGMCIASKTASGIAPTAFPDVCFSPPKPPKIGIPIPYPNTAFAKDTTNGSTTVFIEGQQIMQRDKSFFSTSTGDEPATQAFKKGAITNVIKGKCYFKSWSMNVFVEGLNVCRHMDLTTHNHAD